MTVAEAGRHPIAAAEGLRRRLARFDIGAAGWVGLAILAVFVAVAVAAPLVAPYEAGARTGAPYMPPGADHWLGTDDVGRDLFTSLVFGARTSLIIAGGVAVLATAVGGAVGAIAGASRGWMGPVLMRLVDVVIALPLLPLVVVVAAFAGREVFIQVLMLAAVLWARPARIVRAQTLSAVSRGHVEAAEGMGASRLRTLVRHVSYYVAPLLVPLFIRAGMIAILLETSLAFLGLGDPQSNSWGTTLFWANTRSAVLTDAWLWWVVPPGAAIAAVVTALGLVGMRLEEQLNPNLRSGG